VPEPGGRNGSDHADFLSLLTSFANEIASGNPAEKSWISACRRHKRKGRRIPNDDCPAVLGRARRLEDHARSVAKASFGSLTPQEAKKHLLKHSGSLNPVGFEPFLRGAALGNYIVWATFNSDDPHLDPFDRLPNTRSGICTVLGLGGAILNETLVVVDIDIVRGEGKVWPPGPNESKPGSFNGMEGRMVLDEELGSPSQSP
jgi:hypothetical protein